MLEDRDNGLYLLAFLTVTEKLKEMKGFVAVCLTAPEGSIYALWDQLLNLWSLAAFKFSRATQTEPPVEEVSRPDKSSCRHFVLKSEHDRKLLVKCQDIGHLVQPQRDG